ncbi:type II toxin-antitoxin system VapC family toxin [Thermococcus thioreducens]|uniref:Ribonuclease VapC n=1 Tax=Thermococcus thioreducens TaxID=277988 RepID=A0A0Q2M5W2_9EURY|nr:type II toxin-antitoxin system VapC family toxin [Thermococcus thioreducens]ASJ13290.1 twitching motility protein PilT [Thermococcus thioreducens]KQH83298.1 twitching motility protein PilT [Thermococcus thioreducens]
MRVYVDVNVIYYHLTDNPEFSDRATDLLEEHYGSMITSSLTVWQLYILLRRLNREVRFNLMEILPELGVRIVPLTPEILLEVERVEKLDFDDAIHYTTMKRYGVKRILSNDRDFDKIEEIERVF